MLLSSNPISCIYFDKEMNSYNFGLSYGETDEHSYSTSVKFENYEDNKYLVKWELLQEESLEEPIEIAIE